MKNLKYYSRIEKKLIKFIRYYYFNKLIRGFIIFLLIGLIYMFSIITIENYFWLSEGGREVFFYSLLFIGALAFSRYVLIPLFRYFRIIKNINFENASNIIGNNIKEIDDKLLNIIQLYNNNDKNKDLVIASIEQKSHEIENVKFDKAIKLHETLLFSKYLLIPALIMLIIWGSNQFYNFKESFHRLTDYKKEYIQPAPFKFVILNDSLQAIQGNPFKLQVALIGKNIPNTLLLVHEGKNYSFIRNTSKTNQFQYRFDKLTSSFSFQMKADNFTSKQHRINVQETPSIEHIAINAIFPKHTKIANKEYQNVFSINVPRGTLMNWNIKTADTQLLTIQHNDSTTRILSNDNNFSYKHRLMEDADIKISVSNKKFHNYESLKYKMTVTKDFYPSIKVVQRVDSTFIDRQYLYGIITDDYGISGLDLVYYKKTNPARVYNKRLKITQELKQEFYYTFPTDIKLEEKQTYVYYFKVYDNDVLSNNKTAYSQKFYYNTLSEESIKENYLSNEKQSLKGLDSLISSYYNQKEDNEFLINKQMDYNSTEFEDFLKREMLQQNMMQKFTKNLLQQQERLSDDKNSDLRQRLMKELEEENERKKLLQNIKQLSKKQDPQVKKKMEALKKKNKISKRNLNQILELVKRNFLDKKIKFIIQKIEKLSKSLEDSAQITETSQQERVETFKQIKGDFDEIERFNQTLNKPKLIKRNHPLEQKINRDINDAKSYLNKDPEISKDINKQAAQKLKNMAKNLKENRKQGLKMELKMDLETTRQVMDNLLEFSFEQEALIDRTSALLPADDLSKILIKQNELKQVFQHIDDSIYKLSLSQPKIADKINKQLEEVHYYTESTLKSLSDKEVSRASSSQNFVLFNVNKLSAFISDVLNNIKLNLESGKDQKNEFQLEDIIKNQKKMMDKAQEKLQKEESPEESKLSLKEQIEMYKQQQKIRQALQEFMKKHGNKNNTQKRLNRELEKIEKELINKGITKNLSQKMRLVYKKLLDLKTANYRNNEKSDERKSEMAKQQQNKRRNAAEDYFKDLSEKEDLLLRESLPVENKYRPIINHYFNERINF